MFLDIYIFRRRVKLRQAPECLRDEVEPWRRRGGLRLVDFEEKVEGMTCVVRAIGGWGRAQGDRNGGLSVVGAELRRVRECVGLSQSVAEVAESLVKKYFDVVGGFPAEVVAVAVLWTAAKAAGAPRPLEDFLRCSKSEER